MLGRNLLLFAVLSTLTATSIASCATAPEPVEKKELEPEMTAAESFDAALPWLSDDVQIVSAWAGLSIWDSWGDELLFLENPNAPAGGLGTAEGMRRDFERLFVEYLGYDPGLTHALVTGIEAESERSIAVAFGDFEDELEAPRQMVGDVVVYELDTTRIFGDTADYEFDFESEDEETTFPEVVYMHVIDEPRRGIVFADEAEYFADGPSSAPSGRLADFAKWMGDAGQASFVLAADVEMLAEEFDVRDRPLPELAIVSFGSHLGATLIGDDGMLGEIQVAVDEEVRKLRDEAAEAYAEADGADLLTRLSDVYVYHVIESLSAQLEPQVSEGRLRYEITFAELEARYTTLAYHGSIFSGIWAMRALRGFADEMAYGEAEMMVDQISDISRVYFETEQTYQFEGSKYEPWHPADPSVAEKAPGMPVAFDDKVFVGGRNFKIVTHTTVPEEGEYLDRSPAIVSGHDYDVERILTELNLDYLGASRFRYIYETGPGTGADATAKITAEANFDPSTPEHHRVVQELIVDEREGVIVLPKYTENEGH